VCQKADALGSTEQLIARVEQAPAGSTFAIGTEIHLVNRLAKRFAPQGKKIMTLDDTGCLCTTMYRISPQHLAWVLENLVEGRVVNRVQVKPDVKHWARVALDRMLESRDQATPSSKNRSMGTPAGTEGARKQKPGRGKVSIE
jgi:quinolinate synthase